MVWVIGTPGDIYGIPYKFVKHLGRYPTVLTQIQYWLILVNREIVDTGAVQYVPTVHV
jgi:hypothetical protein